MSADLRIYVACLASYNNGILHGAWVDCDGKDADDIRAEVAAMLAASPVPGAEEWAIHDTDGFAGLIGESDSFDDVALIAEALAGDHARAFRWLVADRGMSASEAAERADEVSIWEDDRGQSRETMLGDYAESFTEETGGLEGCPEHLRNYIDLAEIDGTRFIVTNAAEF